MLIIKQTVIFFVTNSDRSTVTTSLLDLKPGDKVIVETLCTKSEATVVWQDGSIEENIASRELYPIHALDDQEFFPGDFVVRASINSDLGQVSKISFENKNKTKKKARQIK